MDSASFACDGHLGCLRSFATPVMLCTNASLHYVCVCVSLEMFQKIHMDGSETAYPRSAEREAALARLSSLWKHPTETVGERMISLGLRYSALPPCSHHLPNSSPPGINGGHCECQLEHSTEADDHLITQDTFQPSQDFPASSSPRFP